MKKEALSLFAHPELVLFGFLLFFATFLGVLIWVSQRSRSRHYKKMSTMPLETKLEEVPNGK